MFPTQSNTKIGHRQFVGAAGLVGNEAKLLVLSSNAGVPTVALPTAVTDIPQFVLVDDGVVPSSPANLSGQQVEAQPLTPGENIRVKAYGVGTAGTKLVMADPTANAGAQAGMVTALPAGAGLYIQIGVAEEDFVDGQLVLVRPHLRQVVVPTAVAAPVALTSAQNATAAAVDLATSEALANALQVSYNALQADVVALRTTVANLRAALATNKQVA